MVRPAVLPDGLDGISFAQGFRELTGTAPRMYAPSLATGNDRRAIRTKHHNLVRNFAPFLPYATPCRGAHEIIRPPIVPTVELYDLGSDANEFTNVATRPEYQEVCRELDQRLWRWLEEMNDPILHGPTPTPIWHDAMVEYQQYSRARR